MDTMVGLGTSCQFKLDHHGDGLRPTTHQRDPRGRAHRNKGVVAGLAEPVALGPKVVEQAVPHRTAVADKATHDIRIDLCYKDIYIYIYITVDSMGETHVNENLSGSWLLNRIKKDPGGFPAICRQEAAEQIVRLGAVWLKRDPRPSPHQLTRPAPSSRVEALPGLRRRPGRWCRGTKAQPPRPRRNSPTPDGNKNKNDGEFQLIIGKRAREC